MTTYASYAKLNLHLQVCGRRHDGYHELRTLFQTIDLADGIDLEPGGGGIDFRVDGGGAPAGEDNLVVRAVHRFRERWPVDGVRIRLRKRIPMGGGLGGGSSNAATTLLALRELTGRPAAIDELWPLARELGADVPYFLVGGTALGVGRGDEIVPLAELEATRLLVVTPAVHASTAEVFAQLEATSDPALSHHVVRVLMCRNRPSWQDLLGRNDLQKPVLQRFSAIRRVYDILAAWGATEVRLSGSGSSLFCRAGAAVGHGDDSGSARLPVLPSDTLVTEAFTVSRDEIARRHTAK